jgi:Ankyrin repeats (3 copies)
MRGRPAAALAAMLLACAGCGRRAQTAVGGGWSVDAEPQQGAWPHLYFEPRDSDRRMLVDHQITAYRVYFDRCLIYEAPRENGRFLFAMWGGLTPIAFRTSEEPSRWRLDADGPRRFEPVLVPDGRRLLDVEWINFGDPCYVAQLQPKLATGWQDRPPLDVGRVKSERTRLEVDGHDSVGNSTLSDAAYRGKPMLVDELLRAGADVNAANQAGISVLMAGVADGSVEVVRRLIEAGARVNTQDAGGQTALMYAAKYRRLAIARLLVASGAKTSLRDDEGRTAMVWLGEPPQHAPEEYQQLRALLSSSTGEASAP